MLKNFTLFYSEIFKLLIYWGEHWYIKFLYCELKKKSKLLLVCAVQTVTYHRFISLEYIWSYGTTIRLWFMIFFFLSNNIIWTAFFLKTPKRLLKMLKQTATAILMYVPLPKLNNMTKNSTSLRVELYIKRQLWLGWSKGFEGTRTLQVKILLIYPKTQTVY